MSAGAESAALELVGVCKRFGGVSAVNDVSLRLDRGRVLGLIGPNGAGKTTMLNLISGLTKASAGQIRLGGHDVTHWPAHRVAAESKVSRTFQNIRMFAGMSVLENVLTGLHHGIDTNIATTVLRLPRERREEHRARDQAEAVLHRMGLDAYRDRRGDELSYGLQRRVEFARAVVSEPRLLLLDEPTAGMTPRETAEVMELIQELREGALTMIVIEHKAGFIMSVSDQVAVMNFGTVIADGPPSEVRNDPKVIEAYLGAEDVHA